MDSGSHLIDRNDGHTGFGIRQNFGKQRRLEPFFLAVEFTSPRRTRELAEYQILAKVKIFLEGMIIVKALVTGANGFLGLYLVELLLARGDTVRAMSRKPDPALDQLDVESFHGDIRDSQACLKATRDVDVVFHTAAISGIWGKWKLFHDTNIIAIRCVY